MSGITVVLANRATAQVDARRLIRKVSYRAKSPVPLGAHVQARHVEEINADFRAGGRPPFRWKERAINTVIQEGPGPILGGPRGQIRTSMYTKVVPLAGSSAGLNGGFRLRTLGSSLAVIHHVGRDVPYDITPKAGRYLCFLVAARAVRPRTRRRHGGGDTAGGRRPRAFTKKIGPGGRVAPPGAVWLYITRVHRPTITRRPVVVIRHAFRRLHVLAPAMKYFRGDPAWRSR